MDAGERKSFALIVISVLALYFIFEYVDPKGVLFIPLKNDYYVKEVSVEFNKPFIRESITFKVNENKFHQIFKVYYGNLHDIVDFECSDGLHSYFSDVEEGVEIGCESPTGIKPGSYTLTITYKPEVNWSYVKWVIFNYAPRKVESIKSNGKPAYTSSLFGEPVVAFYPDAKQKDLEFMHLIKLLSLIPLIAPVVFVVLLYVTYLLFGREPAINETIPEVYHSIPSQRTPLEVVILFKDPITTNCEKKVKEIINTILAHAIVKEAIDIKKDRIYIIDEQKFNELEEAEREVISLIKEKKMSDKDLRKMYGVLRRYAKKKLKEVYDEKGYWIMMGLSILGLFTAFMMDDIFDSSASYRVFIKSLGAGTILPIYFISIGSLFAVTIFKGHLFGRFKNKEIYKEFLLWKAFRNLLNNQSLIKKYSLKDKNMWGSWLVYAYALGVKKESIKYLIEIGKLYSPAFYSRLNRINGFSTYVWGMTLASRIGRGRGGLGGGFSGGGTFGAR